MTITQDPNILVSMVNMKLRDGDYDSLSDFCLSTGIDERELKSRLQAAGFDYNPQLKQFR